MNTWIMLSSGLPSLKAHPRFLPGRASLVVIYCRGEVGKRASRDRIPGGVGNVSRDEIEGYRRSPGRGLGGRGE